MTHETTHDHPFIAEAIAQYARLDIGQRMRPQPGKSVLVTHPGGRNVEVRTADHLLASFRVVGDDASGYLELSAVRKNVPHKPSIIVDSPRSVRLLATSPTARTTSTRTAPMRPRLQTRPQLRAASASTAATAQLHERVAKLRREVEALKAARTKTKKTATEANAASSPPRPSRMTAEEQRRLDEVFGMYGPRTACVTRNGTSVAFGYAASTPHASALAKIERELVKSARKPLPKQADAEVEAEMDRAFGITRASGAHRTPTSLTFNLPRSRD